MTNSTLGSLFPFIDGQAVKTDFPLSWLQDCFSDLALWKCEVRRKLFELLHFGAPRCEPMPEVVERTACDGYTKERVYFSTTPSIRVPAYVLIPTELHGRAPAIVALHDHGGFYMWGKEKLTQTGNEHPALVDFKKEYYAGHSIASDLARQGYVVIVIDMLYWGERRMILDNDPADWRERSVDMPKKRIIEFNERSGSAESCVAKALFVAGITWPGVICWDDVRTVDYLLTRPEVDPDRIGCVGLSIGALRSLHLAALDDRIKAAVIAGAMCSFPEQLKNHMTISIGFTRVVPGLYRYLDTPDVAALAMPAALLVINGSRDKLFNLDGVNVSFAKLAACYKKSGISEKLCCRLYDAPHEFNVAMQTEAWDWLKKWV